MKPWTTPAKFHLEAEEALRKISALNLVIVRPALVRCAVARRPLPCPSVQLTEVSRHRSTGRVTTWPSCRSPSLRQCAYWAPMPRVSSPSQQGA